MHVLRQPLPVARASKIEHDYVENAAEPGGNLHLALTPFSSSTNIQLLIDREEVR
jgi:hypothetical protein